LAWRIVIPEGLRRHRKALGFVAGLALVVAAVTLRASSLGHWTNATPFLPFFPALIVAAALGGWAPGLITLVASVVVGTCFLHIAASAPNPLGMTVVTRVIGFLIVGGLIVGLVAALAELARAIRVRETLSRELQHRVANNMQTVWLMIEKAKQATADRAASEALNQASDRIGAMSRLHRRLINSSAHVEQLEPLLRDVLRERFAGTPVDVKIDIASISLSVDQTAAIALLVSEAAMNAAKHVFRQQRGTRFEVSLWEIRGRYRLTIRDDGPGYAREVGEAPLTTGFGMSIMRGFAEQLGGSLEMTSTPGATLFVEFPRG